MVNAWSLAYSIMNGTFDEDYPIVDSLNMNLDVKDPTEETMAMSSDGRYKYHEDEILADIKKYVSSTYNGHYTGNKFEFRNVQTIDLMASRDLASHF